MRWWIWTCCGVLLVLALATVPVLCTPEAGADGLPDIQESAPSPAEPSLEAPDVEPAEVSLCCTRCDARLESCISVCGGRPACLDECDSRFEMCAARCGGC